MPRFLIEYEETSVFHVEIEAASESAARQAWIDGDYNREVLVDTNDAHIFSVKELP